MKADEARRLAGEVLVVGLAGLEATQQELEAVAALGPAGFIMFARNVKEPAQVRTLTRSCHEQVPRALLLIDQEGGRVDRLKSMLGPSPAMRTLIGPGASLIERQAALTTEVLGWLGFNFNCAPVVDLDEGHEGNGIGDRSFGNDPVQVAELAGLVEAEHRRAGIAASLKHFPGLGRTRGDTHQVRPVLDLSREDLDAHELRAFVPLLEHADAVMVSHAAFPKLAGRDTPASLCRAIVQELLRDDLGFAGLVVTDDLEMGAAADRRAGERAVQALGAGCDLLLYCHRLEEAAAARDAIAEAVLSGELPEGRLEDAAARVAALRDRLASVPAGEFDEGRLSLYRDQQAELMREAEAAAS
jgi:beta-N-acetylhexosaminidase